MQDNKKNIAFYIGDYTRSGGTERSCLMVANGLASDKNNRVYLLVTNTKEETSFFDIDPTIQIIYLNIKNIKWDYYKLIKRLDTELKINKIDKVVAVEVMSLLFIIPLFIFKNFYKTKTKLWVWEHFNFTVSLGKSLRDWCRKLAAKYADYIIVLTERDTELWSQNLKIRNSIIAINNPSPFDVSDKGYNLDSRKIVAIGRLTYQKGFDKLIDIWSQFLHKYPDKNQWILQIIGSGPDELKLKEQAENLNVSSNIEFISNTPNIKDYYENASLLAMTSRFEGLPMTLIEAQSFGLPIISYDCLTGPSEVISRTSGFLVENNNKNQFIENLYTLLDDEHLRLEMSTYAKIEVLDFSLNKIIEKWNGILNKYPQRLN